jgi:hypothetical protein
MRRNNNKGRRSRRSIASRGSIRPLPFMQNVASSYATIVGTNNTNLTYAFIASDLQSARLVKLRTVRLDFAPLSSSAGFVLVQIFLEDPTTNNLVPVTTQRALNITNRTTISFGLPRVPLGYSQAGSGGTAFSIRTTAVAVVSIQYTLQSIFDVARDNAA